MVSLTMPLTSDAIATNDRISGKNRKNVKGKNTAFGSRTSLHCTGVRHVSTVIGCTEQGEFSLEMCLDGTVSGEKVKR